MNKSIAAAATAAALAFPAANASATTPTKRIVTKTVNGSEAVADRWATWR